jgi:hypothetical protein
LKRLPSNGQYVSPCATPPAKKSQTSYRPVLDRMLFALSMGLSAEPATLNEIRLILTPIVTLWNPYNVALEIEGAVLYQWMDAAHYPNWTFYQNGTQTDSASLHMASLLTKQFASVELWWIGAWGLSVIRWDHLFAFAGVRLSR